MKTYAVDFARKNLTDPRRGFVSIKPAETWEDGLICGNGTMGANALSRPLDETIVFTHERLWMPAGAPVLPPNSGPRLFEIRRLIDQGLYQQATQLVFDISGQAGFMYPDPFVPAFDMGIAMQAKGETSAYVRSVDFLTGQASVAWTDERGAFQRDLFVSRAHGVGVLRISAPVGGTVTCRVELRPRTLSEKLDPRKRERSKEVFEQNVIDLEIAATDEAVTYRNRFARAYPGSIQVLEGMARVIATGGKAEADGTAVAVTGADEVLVLIAIELSRDPDPCRLEAMAEILEALPHDYAALLAPHARLHGELFGRVRLDLGGENGACEPTESLLDAAAGAEAPGPALIEKEFDAGRHNIISSTGELPPALQGIWGGTYGADWAGDFTHNGNVPSAIASMLMGNTPELMLAYTSYMEWLVPYLEINARRIFGARGIVLPSRSSTNGFNNSFAPRFAGAFWVAGAAWAAHFFYDYYLFTGDRAFLADHALPFMEKAAIFFEDYLYEGEDGMYVFSPTQSPENTPANSDSQGSFNATMDVAAARELLLSCIAASRELGANEDRIPAWEAMLDKLPGYMVDDDGIVKEWLTPKLANNDDHRHSSQFYALYDGMPPDIAADPDLQAACRRSIRNKLDNHWTDNERGFMSFGLVQLGQAATSLGDAELAYDCLKQLVTRYWLGNLVSMHNHKALFNMDISGGMPAVIIKMLVASEPGRIQLLPALPAAWPSGTIEGVLCRGQIRIDELHWEAGTVRVRLVSGAQQTITLKAPAAIADISVTNGQGAVQESPEADACRVALPARKAVTLELALAAADKA